MDTFEINNLIPPESERQEADLAALGIIIDVILVKKRYTTPTLKQFGDLRSLTLSPSPGPFESGPGAGFRP